MTSEYTLNGSREKRFLSDYQKRNLLLSYLLMSTHHNNPNEEVSMVQNEDSRLKEFRQLKHEIRGSTQHLVVGIDVAKDNHTAFFGTPAGKTLLRGFVFDNSRAGFEKLLFQADTLKTREGLAKLVFGMEPTADYHKPLGEYLITHGHTVVLVAGTAVKKNRELLDGRWDKYDPKDAANVADLITQGKCLFYELPSLEIRELRSLLSLKRRLKKSEQSHKVRIRNHLIAQYFPEMDAYFSYSEGPAIVRWCLDPVELAELPFEKFVRMVLSVNGGVQQRRRLGEIHTRAASSIGCMPHPSVAFEAATLLEGLRQLHSSILEMDKKIAEVCRRFPEYPCLLSIPGFGPDSSAKVLGALGNPHRFENHRQVLKLAGLDLSADRSGKRTEVTPVISKRGKADLRYGLYQAAFIASTRNHHFMAYFTNKLKGREKEKGIGTKMRIKLAAKMLIIAWTLMKKKELFDPGCMEE
jgi:transposase